MIDTTTSIYDNVLFSGPLGSISRGLSIASKTVENAIKARITLSNNWWLTIVLQSFLNGFPSPKRHMDLPVKTIDLVFALSAYFTSICLMYPSVNCLVVISLDKSLSI